MAKSLQLCDSESFAIPRASAYPCGKAQSRSNALQRLRARGPRFFVPLTVMPALFAIDMQVMTCISSHNHCDEL